MAMVSSPVSLSVETPWHLPEFFSEEGLRAAQEYYFQTHAKNSRLIAEARNAQGISKSFVRRKLTREMGEDFKMYTGTILGKESDDAKYTRGIRGEMNAMLGHIYRKIAPGKPITSPAQEDSTILSHPHGGIEVCFAMVCFYKTLLTRYASLATNRRKVLKSIMDEELFKWIWRTVIGFMMAPEEKKISMENSTLSSGLSFIPADLQKAPFGQKLFEIGMFLLSKNMQDSELRVPISHYFVIYMRQMQTLLLMKIPRQEVEGLLKKINRLVEGDLIEHPLVAMDRLMNDKGSSMDSFDDIMKDEAQLNRLIPGAESEFINQFEDFGNPKRLANTLRKLIPDPRKEPEADQHTTLMPLLMLLRTMPSALSNMLLKKLPVPILNMIRNRILNTASDDVGKELMDRIRSVLDVRREQGEKYALVSSRGDQKAAAASSVRVSREPASKTGESAGTASASASAASSASSASQSPADAPEKATPTEKEVGVELTAGDPAAGNILDERSVLAWRVENGRVATVSISAREVMALTGRELRFVLPWVVFTLRTGQIFGIALDAITKETVESLVTDLRNQFGDPPYEKLSPETLAEVSSETKGAPMSMVLLELAKAAGLGNFKEAPESLKPALDSLCDKMGDQLEAFLRQPAAEEFRELRSKLKNKEREALTILHRVARTK